MSARDNCPLCCGDSFECGGGVSGVCIVSDGGPYCCLPDKDGSACGEAHPCHIHRANPAPSAEPDCEFINSGQTGSRSLDPWCRTHERSAICCLRDARADVPSAEERAELLSALQVQQNSALAMGDRFNECKTLLRRCWRNVVTVDTAHAIFDWFKAQGEDLNELHGCAAKEGKTDG